MNFVCPKCREPLFVSDGGTAKCKNNHSYDRARQGYYNLLLTSVGGTHGDNLEMVEARRDFLDTGAYLPLAKRISLLLRKYARGPRVLDVGCGEGYYTDIILAENPALSVSAFDISRDAVKHAAKRNKGLALAVAGAYDMPVADGSFDVVLNMFSPLVPAEVHRALDEGGIFIMAVPGEEHLFALKSATYKTPYKNELSDSALDGFSLLHTERLTYELRLDEPEKIRTLFMMTPYAYRTRKEDRERVLSLKELATEVDFVIFVYKKA
ncbi:MAG: methyltransferase domain-containing protein [Clostridia bacterium]|nr:methyltransferase domain-containing protein [Clostridia bacterium]